MSRSELCVNNWTIHKDQGSRMIGGDRKRSAKNEKDPRRSAQIGKARERSSEIGTDRKKKKMGERARLREIDRKKSEGEIMKKKESKTQWKK